MDPLKPFSSSIRALWERSANRTERNERSVNTSSANVSQGPAPIASASALQTLHSRLRTRLANLQTWDAARARELFVESVVLSELGDAISADPAFTSLVERVGKQLGANHALSVRLDQLLQQARQERNGVTEIE
jgi:hypothetical protein